MPRYDYSCPKGHTTEHEFPITSPPPESVTCPTCKRKSKRIFMVPSISIKGEGSGPGSIYRRNVYE